MNLSPTSLVGENRLQASIISNIVYYTIHDRAYEEYIILSILYCIVHKVYELYSEI